MRANKTFESVDPYDLIDEESEEEKIIQPKRKEDEDVERQMNLLLNRDVIVRRGRNNRVMMKFIERNIF